ncbi:hypothetical protein CAP36_01450 [Chitinophagaceae bacterium IBVUCB2]|nr:hypothetical protein CAP36_01450 [Chitinophagaceae bacterium IBVUCB2]
MKKYAIYWLALSMVLITGCQKEVSFELSGIPAEGTLQSETTGDCLPKTVNGVYEEGVALSPNINTITVDINVTKAGTYTITTDTVNGYFFKGTGRFTTPGVNTVTLQSQGTPFAQGINNFVVSFLGTVCDIQVDVLPAGAGGPAVFTLVNGGAPANCASAVISGTYIKDAAVTSSNYVDVTVNVTTIGTYTITATGGGLTFARTAAFTTTGNQTVRLNASGTPPTAGANTITFAAPFAACSFTVNVVAPVTGTLGGAPGACTPVTPNGTYTQGVTLTAANTIQIQITTSAVGAYNISTNSVAGISFSGSGTTTGALQTITLAGTGTPNASGPQVFTVTYGTSTCTFTINIGAAAGPAVFTINCPGVVVNGTYQVGVNLTAANTIVIPINLTTPGSYSVTTSINGMSFSFSGNLPAGTTSVTLVGNTANAPTGPAGTYNLSIGSPACLIPITVTAAPTIDWKFTITGGATYQGRKLSADYDVSTAAPATIMEFEGDNATGDYFYLGLGDITGGILAGEIYKANATQIPPENAADFYFENLTGTVTFEATPIPTNNGTNLKVTITSHDLVGKVIIGTFDGTVKDQTGAVKTIAVGAGTFTIRY